MVVVVQTKVREEEATDVGCRRKQRQTEVRAEVSSGKWRREWRCERRQAELRAAVRTKV